MQIKKYKLNLDRSYCVGCQICSLACPKNAIKVEKQLKVPGEKARTPKVDIELSKCNFCGVCDVTCPYGAIKVTLNGEHNLNLLDKESYPRLNREITVNSLRVKKIFEGILTINQEKCPQNCHDCLDVCPIKDVLVFGKDNKVHVNEQYCTYCGACKVACPVDEALILKRTRVHHEPIHSGTWNQTLARITSSVDEVKELKCTATKKRREMLFRRLKLGAKKNE